MDGTARLPHGFALVFMGSGGEMKEEK